MRKYHPGKAVVLLILVFIPLLANASQAVNVYSARQEALIKPLLDRFTEQTGIQVNLVTGKADALLARISLEGENSPADVLITTDAGRLHRAKVSNLLQRVDSATLDDAIPPGYRDRDGYWFGLSVRARVIVAARGKVDTATVDSYESLASPALRGKLCIRSSDNIYNQSLVASMIAAHGERKTLEWARGVVANFARPPAGGDRDQVLAVAGGLCDVAVVNTYYLAVMLSGDNANHRRAARQVEVVWPDQSGRGTHVNVSGAGVTQMAGMRSGATAAAIRLIEYLVSPSAQSWYARVNSEYPLRASGGLGTPILQSWGDFKRDPLNLETLGELNGAAVRLMNSAGWH